MKAAETIVAVTIGLGTLAFVAYAIGVCLNIWS